MWRASFILLLLSSLLPVAAPAGAAPDDTSTTAGAASHPPAARPSSAPAAANAPSAGAEPKAAAPPSRTVEQLNPGSVIGILGKQVEGPGGADMGQLVEVLVDHNGQPVAAVIDFGGFLGMGSRKIAVDWHLLEFRPGASKSPVLLHLDRAALQGAPEYKVPASPSQPVEIVGPPPAAGVAAPSNGER